MDRKGSQPAPGELEDMAGKVGDKEAVTAFQGGSEEHIRFLRNKWYDTVAEADKVLLTVSLAGIGLELALVRGYDNSVSPVVWNCHWISLLSFVLTVLWYRVILWHNKRLFVSEMDAMKSLVAWAKSNEGIPVGTNYETVWEPYKKIDAWSKCIDRIYWCIFLLGMALFCVAIWASPLNAN